MITLPSTLLHEIGAHHSIKQELCNENKSKEERKIIVDVIKRMKIEEELQIVQENSVLTTICIFILLIHNV